jgi:hypothetical protein
MHDFLVRLSCDRAHCRCLQQVTISPPMPVVSFRLGGVSHRGLTHGSHTGVTAEETQQHHTCGINSSPQAVQADLSSPFSLSSLAMAVVVKSKLLFFIAALLLLGPVSAIKAGSNRQGGSIDLVRRERSQIQNSVCCMQHMQTLQVIPQWLTDLASNSPVAEYVSM